MGMVPKNGKCLETRLVSSCESVVRSPEPGIAGTGAVRHYIRPQSWGLRGEMVELGRTTHDSRPVTLETQSRDVYKAGLISCPKWSMRQFAVTEDDSSIVALVQSGLEEEVGIRRIKLGSDMRTKWELEQAKLEEMVEGNGFCGEVD